MFIRIQLHMISLSFLLLSCISFDTFPLRFLIPLFSILSWVPLTLVLFTRVRLNFDQSGHVWWLQILQLLLDCLPSLLLLRCSDMTLKAIMAQLQHMDACLDTLTIKLYQVNTCVGHIAQWQVRLGGFAPSPTPSLSPMASDDEDSNGGADGDEDASSSDDAEMTTS